MKLYLDACSIIYAIEGLPIFRGAVLARVAAIEERADVFLTGDAALARCSGLHVDVI
jgi:hypothetical protein